MLEQVQIHTTQVHILAHCSSWGGGGGGGGGGFSACLRSAALFSSAKFYPLCLPAIGTRGEGEEGGDRREEGGDRREDGGERREE